MSVNKKSGRNNVNGSKKDAKKSNVNESNKTSVNGRNAKRNSVGNTAGNCP